MNYRNIIIVLGFLVIVVHFLGFPVAWNNAFYTLFGLAIIALAYIHKP